MFWPTVLFKPPEKHPGWSGTLKAFSAGQMCVQYSMITDTIIGNEDCLYLNVFVPQVVKLYILFVVNFLRKINGW